MRRPSRIRRTAKWAGLTLSLLIMAMWAVSYRWSFAASAWGWGGVSTCGILSAVELLFDEEQASCFVVPSSGCADEDWGLTWPEFWSTDWGVSSSQVPFWFPFLLIAAPTGILWYRDRHHIQPGHCQKCGYNLTGNTSGKCPECGTACDVQTGGGRKGDITDY